MAAEPEVIDTFAPIPFVERGKSIVLGGDPKGKKLLYPLGKIVVIRDLENPAKCDVYSQHTYKVTAAKYAPSGNYICSGEVTGKIKIWDALNEEHIQKNEFRPFAGEIRDLVWGPENKRIAVCGQGSSVHAACITWDSGNNLGIISSVEKRGNSIDLKPNRPFRLVVGDDGHSVGFYEGPPFKCTKTLRDHSRFVNCVRYSPDGKYFSTASSDGHMYLYDGKTSEKVGEFGDEKSGAHGGGIYGIAWSGNSKEILTVSGDKTAKIWDVETKQSVVTFNLGKDVLDQQYSCAWIGDHILTVSLSGNIKYLDRSNPDTPLKVIYGHNKPMACVVAIPSEKRHVSSDAGGKLLWWDTEAGVAHAFLGSGHTNKVVGLCFDAESNKIISAAWDDTIRFTDATTFDFNTSTTVSLDSQPKAMALAGRYVAINTEKSIVLLKDEKKVYDKPHDLDRFQPTIFGAGGNDVAVEIKNNAIQIYHIERDALVDSGIQIPSSDAPSGISYSPDASTVAVGYANNDIRVYLVADSYKLHKNLIGHHMKPSKFAWSPNSQCLFSSGMDASLRQWNIATDQKDYVRYAHPRSLVNGICCFSDETLITAGDEGVTRVWKITW